MVLMKRPKFPFAPAYLITCINKKKLQKLSHDATYSYSFQKENIKEE